MAAPRQRGGRKRNISFYLTAEEQAAAAQALELEGIDAEIALLRVLIRKVLTKEGKEGGAAQDDAKEVRLHIEALCKALRLQHLLTGRAADKLAESLANSLDQIGVQLGRDL